MTTGQPRDKTGPHPRSRPPHGLRHTRRHASAPSVASTRSCTQQEPRRLLRAWTKAAPATQLSRRNAASRLQVPRTCRSRTPSRRSRAHVTPLFDHFQFDLCHFDHYIVRAGAEHTQSESGRAGDAHAVHLLRSRAHDGAIRPQVAIVPFDHYFPFDHCFPFDHDPDRCTDICSVDPHLV